MSSIELNQGEIKVQLSAAEKGKISLEALGLKDENLFLEGGLLRLAIGFGAIETSHFYQVPTIEIAYNESVAETHWQCDYNGETILDKTDHFGKSTVILISRKKLDTLEHRHENTLVLHAEFPSEVNLIASESFIHFF